MNAVEFLASHNTSSRKSSLPRLSLPPHHTSAAAADPTPPRGGAGRVGTQGAAGPPATARHHQPVLWRGHGGRQPTASSVEFDRQLDKVSIWLERWDHDTVSIKSTNNLKQDDCERSRKFAENLHLVLSSLD